MTWGRREGERIRDPRKENRSLPSSSESERRQHNFALSPREGLQEEGSRVACGLPVPAQGGAISRGSQAPCTRSPWGEGTVQESGESQVHSWFADRTAQDQGEGTWDKPFSFTFNSSVSSLTFTFLSFLFFQCCLHSGTNLLLFSFFV